MSEEEKIIEIPLDQILEPSLAIRKTLDEEKLEELAESIKAVGLKQYPEVKKVNDKYEVIAGHRRVLAARMAGLVMIRCRLSSPTKEEEIQSKLHENYGREDLQPLEEAVFFANVMQDLNLSVSELSQQVKKPERYIQERLALLSMPADIKDALAQRKIGLGVAKQFSRVENEVTRKMLLSRAIVDGVSENRAKMWADEYSKVKPEEPAPSPEKVEEKIQEMEEFYSTPCEVCGSKVKKELWGTIEGHKECLRIAQELAWEKIDELAKEEEKQTGEKPAQ